MTSSARDQIYRTPIADIGGFRFDRQVVDVFPDMLDRSIPGYSSIIAQSGLLAEHFAREGTRCYDLGCSLGATLLSMRHAISCAECELVGVDNSSAMIERCEELIDADDKATIADRQSDSSVNPNIETDTDTKILPPISLINADIEQVEIDNASVVALNFTLQFVEPAYRSTLLNRIGNAIVDGGALILSEKIKFDDQFLHDLYTDQYHAFKKANGYSDLEISQKRSALENVLIPDTVDTHLARLGNAGFKHCSVWFQCFNFVSIIAVK